MRSRCPALLLLLLASLAAARPVRVRPPRPRPLPAIPSLAVDDTVALRAAPARARPAARRRTRSRSLRAAFASAPARRSSAPIPSAGGDARTSSAGSPGAQPDWPYAWHALALAEIRRAAWERADPAGARQPGRDGALERALEHERRALAADPGYRAGGAHARRPRARPARHHPLRRRARRAPPGRRRAGRRRRPSCCWRAGGSSAPPTSPTPRSPRSSAPRLRAAARRRAVARLELARTRLALGAAERRGRVLRGAPSPTTRRVVAGYRADLGADRGRLGPRAVRRRARRRPRRRGSAASGPTATTPSSATTASGSASTTAACSTPAATSRSPSRRRFYGRRDAYRSRQRGARRPRRDLRAPRRAADPAAAVRVRPHAERDLALRPGRRRPPVPLQRRLRRCRRRRPLRLSPGGERARPARRVRRARSTSCCSRARPSRRSTAACSTGVPTAPRAPRGRERGHRPGEHRLRHDDGQLRAAVRPPAHGDRQPGRRRGTRTACRSRTSCSAIGPAETTPAEDAEGVSYPVRVRVVVLDGAEHAVAQRRHDARLPARAPARTGAVPHRACGAAAAAGRWGWRAAHRAGDSAGVVLPRDTVRPPRGPCARAQRPGARRRTRPAPPGCRPEARQSCSRRSISFPWEASSELYYEAAGAVAGCRRIATRSRCSG